MSVQYFMLYIVLNLYFKMIIFYQSDGELVPN